MTPPRGNRFEDFYVDDTYVSLKNLLYNYLLRRRAVRKCVQGPPEGLILEVGSGLSPMLDGPERIVYSDLSFSALRMMKRRLGRGHFVVADATQLPFRAGSFPQVICSEVLEHLPEDRLAIREIASVLKTEGSLILTFPHRRCYFTADDRFVNHCRRYELEEIEANLKEAGLTTVAICKVLGPLEKITMLLAVSLLPLLESLRLVARNTGQGSPLPVFAVTAFRWLNRLYCAPVWLDARLWPRRLSSVLLLRAVRRR